MMPWTSSSRPLVAGKAQIKTHTITTFTARIVPIECVDVLEQGSYLNSYHIYIAIDYVHDSNVIFDRSL